MTTRNRADIYDSRIAASRYEIMRGNALGDINQTSGVTLFLRHGMKAWLHALQGKGTVYQEVRKESSYDLNEPDTGISRDGLIAILADAVLNSARSNGFGG